jgi:hypothetical protein
VNGRNTLLRLNRIDAMKFADLPLHPTPRMLRQFAAGWLVCFLALAIRFGLIRHLAPGLWLGLVALVGIPGLLFPRVLYWPFVILTVITFPIGWVMTQLVLAFMFFLVLTPLAIIFRWRRRDSLQLRARSQSTFWVKRPEKTPPEKYLKQF